MSYLVLICALTLLCVAAVEFGYVLFLEGVVRQQKRRIAELERELSCEFGEGEEFVREDSEAAGEAWPEVVDEDDYRVR
jgi:hypothetical protein